MGIQVYIAGDGDKIGHRVGMLSLADDVEGLRRVSQAIENGNRIWASWAQASGGSVISYGGDEFRLQIPADKLIDLPKLRVQYSEAVGAPVSVGVGSKLHEADQALMAAKLRGGDQIVLFSPKVAQEVAQLKQKSEEEKLSDEYLGKADGPAGPQQVQPVNQPALNERVRGGGIIGPSMAAPAGPEAPASPVAEGSEHSQAEAAQSQLDDAGEQGGGQDLHAEFGAMASQGQAQDDQQQEQDDSDSQTQDLKSQVVDVLKTFQARKEELEQLSQQDPEMYKALVGMMQVMVQLSQQVFKATAPQDQQQGQPVQKAEVEKEENHAHNNDRAIRECQRKGTHLKETHEGTGICTVCNRAGTVGAKPAEKAELAPSCKHFFGDSDKCLRCKEPKLDKAALEAGKTGRHNVVLPSGSQVDAAPQGTREVGKIKVTTPDDQTHWRSVRAGIVMDPQGVPTSSRNPSGSSGGSAG